VRRERLNSNAILVTSDNTIKLFQNSKEIFEYRLRLPKIIQNVFKIVDMIRFREPRCTLILSNGEQMRIKLVPVVSTPVFVDVIKLLEHILSK